MNIYTLNVFACNREWENCGKYFPMNATGHVPEFWLRLFDMFGVIRLFSINIWVEVHFFCIDWEKWHGLKCNFLEALLFLNVSLNKVLLLLLFQRWLILKLTCEHKNLPPASITNHLLLWMNAMFDFICIGFAMRNTKKATNSKWKWMSLEGIKPAWIKATRCNIGVKLIMVRYILELTVQTNSAFLLPM